MALILAVSFLTVTIILMLVIIAFVFSVIRAGMIRKIEPYNMLIRE